LKEAFEQVLPTSNLFCSVVTEMITVHSSAL